MARFRPSRLFRRFSSRSDTQNSSKARSQSRTRRSPSPSYTSDVPTPPAPVYAAPPSGQLRKSSSLPRLRKPSGTQGRGRSDKSGTAGERQRERRESVPELPELTSEAIAQHLARNGSGVEVGSEEDTVSVDKSSGQVDLVEQKEALVSTEELRLDEEDVRPHPLVIVEHPTPDVVQEVREVQQGSLSSTAVGEQGSIDDQHTSQDTPEPEPELPPPIPRKTATSAEPLVRHPSIIDSSNVQIIQTLINAPDKGHDRTTSTDSYGPPATSQTEYFARNLPNMAAMLHRKVWVKRPGASATLVQIKEDDLVDDVRDMILRKYANSLGKTFDAPDMTLHILSRQEQGANRTERTLGPEEEICRTIDQLYPGGQSVNEALIIDVPQRRTPRPSPHVQQPYQQQNYYALDEFRPLENGTDYFPPMPVNIPPTVAQTSNSDAGRSNPIHHSVAVAQTAAHPAEHHPRSISIINTGQLPALPSPGGQSRRHQHRPRYQRQPTSSPTILSHPGAGAGPAALTTANPQPQMVHRASARPRLDSSASEAQRPNGIAIPPAPPLPTPPAPEAAPTNKDNSAPPTPSAAVAPVGVGLHARAGRPKKPRKTTPETQTINGRRKKESSSASSPHPSSAIASLLDASVPPINVLIVEDNTINLRILEGLMKRLKVRWQTAMNGQIAVDKWKAGGFHLVLMDIQMPVMNGLQATKEIRRLERANSIGVFSSTSPDDDEKGPLGELRPPSSGSKEKSTEQEEPKDDGLPGLSSGLIKSPVIIVALTASSLQSDRHEALAAGCNDFLTKPVNFVWLERKVKEWGCMQALIDFDGWRKWKEYAAKQEAGKTDEEKAKEREKEEKERVRGEKMAKLAEKQAKAKEEKEKKKLMSLNVSESGGGGGGGASAGPASPGVPATAKKDSDVNGTGTGAPLEQVSSASFKPGKQVLGEACFDLG